jgi:hypothetical protein
MHRPIIAYSIPQAFIPHRKSSSVVLGAASAMHTPPVPLVIIPLPLQLSPPHAHSYPKRYSMAESIVSSEGDRATPLISLPTAHPERRLPPHESAPDDDPWDLKLILTLGWQTTAPTIISTHTNALSDGGGVKGYGSLLMLRELMREIQTLEEDANRPDSPHETSFRPFPALAKGPDVDADQGPQRRESTWTPETLIPTRAATKMPLRRSKLRFFRKKKQLVAVQETRDGDFLKPTWSGYLPCHYFDYIGGTSTGG